TGLFAFTDNESELASVMAHEISHVTQRHLARAMEAQKRAAPLVWAGAIGSILLSMANPQAGMAALTTTMAGGAQNMISFTQSNEQEADRIGMRVLASAGFDPRGMPNFMQKLLDQSRYSSRPPEILLTHPLPESRLADARNRANQFPHKLVASSQDFLLAKVRVLTMYKNGDPKVLHDWLEQLSRGNVREQNAARYGQAILAHKQKKNDLAATTLQPLLSKESNNVWYLDLMTDIDLDRHQAAKAISRLEDALKGERKDPVLQINLANAYLEANRAADASKLLYRYTFNYPDDMNGWDLLTKASAMQGLRSEELAARAETMALTGNLDQAIQLLGDASKQAKMGSLNQARYDARLDQLRQLQKRFLPIAKN
ncbi:MAG: M48 family metalloprotease, partial [Enterobacteriaceae bacterium]